MFKVVYGVNGVQRKNIRTAGIFLVGFIQLKKLVL